jgi:hypothetical protein
MVGSRSTGGGRFFCGSPHHVSTGSAEEAMTGSAAGKRRQKPLEINRPVADEGDLASKLARESLRRSEERERQRERRPLQLWPLSDVAPKLREED